MLKHPSIIERLSRRQKVALLTEADSLSDADINLAGVPSVRLSSLEELMETAGFPPCESMACSWDTELAERTALALSAPACGVGNNVIVTPDLKCAVNAYEGGLSEDPRLNGALGAAMARGVHAAGAACALSRAAVSEKDVVPLDVSPDPLAVETFVRAPFRCAMAEEPFDAAVSTLRRAPGGYYETNGELFRAAQEGAFGKKLFMFGEDLSADVDYHTMLAGACLGGATVSLDRAIGRYEHLAASRDAGGTSERELAGAVGDGSAIPMEAVDEAVDHTIDFALSVRARTAGGKSADIEQEARRAAEESFVLLKNGRLLPLKEGARIAVIGDGYPGFPFGEGLVAAGHADYDAGSAVPLVSQSEAAVIFLHPEEGPRRTLALPPRELALIVALRRFKRRLIAVVTDTLPPDCSFDSDFAAVLLAPPRGKFCAEALTAILTGRKEPTGRLTRTCFEQPDRFFRSLSEDKHAGCIKAGAFIGYRYTETAGVRAHYAFGHGLGYTRFSYSALRLEANRVRFTLKNCGDRDGTELVQVYVGPPDALFPVPKKQLVAFSRVSLRAGEARQVTVSLPPDAFSVYDGASRLTKPKAGIYTVSIGASASDVRLRGVRLVEGEEPERSKEGYSDYFREYSNAARGFSLKGGVARPLANKLVRGISFGLLLMTLFLAVVMGAGFLSDGNFTGSELVITIVFLAVALISAFVFGLEARNWKRRIAEGALMRRDITFAGGAGPAGQDALSQDPEKSASHEEGSEPDEPRYFDKEFTFAEVCRELGIYAAERGVVMPERDVRDLLSAMSSAQLLLFPAYPEAKLNALANVLSEYFGTRFMADDASGTGTPFFVNERSGWRRSALAEAVTEAEQKPSLMHLALIRHQPPEGLSELRSVRRVGHARLLAEGRPVQKQGVTPPNLWVFVGTEEGTLPEEILNIAAVLSPAVELTPPREERTPVRPLGSYQFYNLCSLVREQFPMREGYWKKLDRLEARLGSEEAPCRFGNRAWTKLEMHASTYCAAGGEEDEAFDSAIAAELLPSIADRLAALDGEGRGTVILEDICGGQIACCRKIIGVLSRASANREE